MLRIQTARYAALLLGGSLAAMSAPAQQPTSPAAPLASPAAPIERTRSPLPPGRFDYGPMMTHGRDLSRFDHSGAASEFRIVPPGMWWRNPGLVERVGLTVDETKKMDDIFQQSRLQLVDLKANLEKQNLILEPMLSANPIDQGKALAQIEKVAQARAELEKANARMLLGIRAVLTPEQWTKLQTGGREMGPHTYGPGGSVGATIPGRRSSDGAPRPNQDHLQQWTEQH